MKVEHIHTIAKE